MATAQQDMGVASSVLGGLSKFAPGEAGTAFGAGAAICDVLGSIFGISSADKAAKATAKYRKEVVGALDDIRSTLDAMHNQLKAVNQELGVIESLLTNVYNAIETSNDISIDKLLAVIDTTWENFKSLDPKNPANDQALQEYATQAFADTDSVLYAMNTIHEVLNSQVFTQGGALEGQMPIAGYVYVQSKLVMGLSLLGYACNFLADERDFGTYQITWYQHFADQMKAIIDYGKRHPSGKGHAQSNKSPHA